MSTKITAIEGADGETIYVEYDEADSEALEEAGDSELQAVGYIDDIKERTEKFKTVLQSTIKGYSTMVLSTVKESMEDKLKPSKVSMEFGIQAGGETGVPFVTKGSAQANVKVTIEWEIKD